MPSGEEIKDLDHNKVQTSTIDLLLQVLAILILVGLLIIDKGMGLMKSPIQDSWYGVISAFAFGGIDFFKSIVKSAVDKKL